MPGWRVLVILTGLLVAGCAPAAQPPPPKTDQSTEADQRIAQQAETRERNRKEPPFTSENLRALMQDPTHAAHLRLFRESNSYYALLELSEGIIEPEIGRIRRRDIQELLGKGDPDYPNSQGKLLAYGGDRQIPYGSHLLIHFDDNDVVDTVDWVSE